MRTNIVIDPALREAAMKAGPYSTKRDAVEAGLALLARQAAYREVLTWRGKLHWEGGEVIDWTRPPDAQAQTRKPLQAQNRAPEGRRARR